MASGFFFSLKKRIWKIISKFRNSNFQRLTTRASAPRTTLPPPTRPGPEEEEEVSVRPGAPAGSWICAPGSSRPGRRPARTSGTCAGR